MTEFKVGDRILCTGKHLIPEVKDRKGTVTKVESSFSVYAMIDDVRNPSPDGWCFNPDNIELDIPEPTEDEIAALFGVKSPNRDVHFLHPEARDLDFDGMAALCDWMNQLEETPRIATESSVVPEDVTCQDCLNFMDRLAYVWRDGADAHRDYHRGATTKVPQNPYWGDGSE